MTKLISTILLLFFSEFATCGFVRFLRPIVLDPPGDATVSTRILSDQYFEQKIDHFNPTDTRTYLQRYHINDELFNVTSGNVFIMLGGEWEATTRWLNYGPWYETAEEHDALLIYLEHRYYGISQPFSDLSTENLQYLSAHQALEDTANFIQGINDLYNITDPKWIVFGGSYAGTLATWLRHKYPHLVTGAMASSGPLEAVLDFSEYLQVVRDSLETHSTSCVDNIKEGFSQLEELVSSCLEDTEVYEELNEMFTLCDSIESSDGNDKDLSNLYEYLVDNVYAYVVQYNGRYNITIDTICDIMVNETEGTTALQRLAEVHSLLLDYLGENCTDYKYDNLITEWKNTTIVASSMMRQWVYQTCTEFGFFQTTSQEDPIFGSRIDVSYFTDICIDVFGTEFTETITTSGIAATNVRYGGRNITTSNIVHFHGKIDPWHALGRLETTDDVGDAVIIVDGASHCANMYPASENDPEGLDEARAEVNRLIGVWLNADSSAFRACGSFVAAVLMLIVAVIVN